MKKLVLGLSILVGICGVIGGIFAFFFAEKVGIDVSILHNFFPNFIAPGLFLLLIIGGGNLINIALYKLSRRLIFYWSIIMGIILIVWLIVQCIIILDIEVAHIVFLIIGIIQIIIGLRALKQIDKEV